MPLIMQFIPQFRPEAKDVALSYIISDMYSHVMGPDVNSNAIINAVRQIITGICISKMLRTPASAKMITIEPYPTTISVRLPYFERRNKPPKVAKKLAPLRIGVAILDGTLKPTRIVFE